MASTQYAFYGGLHKDLDPQTTGEHLESLVERYNGKLTLEEILADARRRESPLHKGLTWDNTLAAEKQRRSEAKHLVANLVIKPKKAPQNSKEARQTTRAFVFVHTAGYGRKVWVPLKTAMQNAEQREEIKENAFRDFRRWRERYGGRREMAFAKKEIARLERAFELELMSAVGVYR